MVSLKPPRLCPGVVTTLATARRILSSGVLAVVTCVMLLASGCSSPPPSTTGPSDGVLSVYTVNYPLQYFAERIGGDAVEVTFPAPADVDPAHWSPGEEEIVAYQQADLILLNGASYAGWVARVSLPQAKLCDTSAAISDQLIPETGNVTHSHGPEGRHVHHGVAFTIWLDPLLAIAQADATREAFSRLRPEKAQVFAENFAALKEDLLELDRRLEQIAQQSPSLPIVMSHPVYQYLIRRYDLNAQSVHWEPDQRLDAAALREIETDDASQPATGVVWEAQPLAENVATLQQAGLESAVFNPCATRPQEGDYLDMMRRNIEELARLLGK